jgi:hypothetical protein
VFSFLQYNWNDRNRALPLGACHPVAGEGLNSSTFSGIQHGMYVLIEDEMAFYVLLKAPKKLSLANVCIKFIKRNPTM